MPQLRVLYVDDDAVNLRVISAMLLAGGITVTCVSSGREALECLRTDTFDLVLMDYHMPELNGAQTLQKIRESAGPNNSIPVVVITADTSIQGEYIDLGFSGFLSKPVSLRPLLTEAFLWSVKRNSLRPLSLADVSNAHGQNAARS